MTRCSIPADRVTTDELRYGRRVEESTGSAASSDGRRLRGQRTRNLILARAVDTPSAEGLDSLSLARLGADLNISKSGVKGHFTSRIDLELAVIGVAAKLYIDRVVTPAQTKPDGLPQLWQLREGWIEFMRSGELSGRSFFLTALVEYDARPGPIRDERLRLQWERLVPTPCTSPKDWATYVPPLDAA